MCRRVFYNGYKVPESIFVNTLRKMTRQSTQVEKFIEESPMAGSPKRLKFPLSPPSLDSYGWEQYYSSGSPDFLVRSEGSSASWTDEVESDSTLQLQDQLLKFESALYGDKTHEGLEKTSLKESFLWSNFSPHLRVIGKAIKPIEVETEEIYDENYEEVFASHGEYDGLLDETVDDPSDLETSTRTELQKTNDCMDEVLKNEILQKMFEKVWPEVLQRVTPVVKKFFENRPVGNLVDGNQTSSNSNININLNLEKDISAPSLSTFLQGSVRSRSTHSTIPESESPSGDDYVSVKSSLSSCHLVPRKKPMQMSQAIVLPPPQTSESFMPVHKTAVRKVRHVSAFHLQPTERCSNLQNFQNESRLRYEVGDPFEINKPRNGLLPPIDTIGLSPKTEKVGYFRSSSALLRCPITKSSNQSRLNSSRNKSGLLTPIEIVNAEFQVKGRRNLGSQQTEEKLPFPGSPVSLHIEERRLKERKPLPWK